MAKEYSQEKYQFFDPDLNKSRSSVLFISDIRSTSSTMNLDQMEERVQVDMEMQRQWVKMMKPRHSMLKFRLSWHPGITNYLKGNIHLPVWGPITTSESRLITQEKIEEQEYDNTQYEQQMFYFNTEYRVARFPHNVEGEGICHCYDCTAEIEILYHYLKSSFSFSDTSSLSNAEVWKLISSLSSEISRKISLDRTLLSPNPDPGKRLRFISERQQIGGRPAHQVAAELKNFQPVVYHGSKDKNVSKKRSFSSIEENSTFKKSKTFKIHKQKN